MNTMKSILAASAVTIAMSFAYTTPAHAGNKQPKSTKSQSKSKPTKSSADGSKGKSSPKKESFASANKGGAKGKAPIESQLVRPTTSRDTRRDAGVFKTPSGLSSGSSNGSTSATGRDTRRDAGVFKTPSGLSSVSSTGSTSATGRDTRRDAGVFKTPSGLSSGTPTGSTSATGRDTRRDAGVFKTPSGLSSGTSTGSTSASTTEPRVVGQNSSRGAIDSAGNPRQKVVLDSQTKANTLANSQTNFPKDPQTGKRQLPK